LALGLTKPLTRNK